MIKIRSIALALAVAALSAACDDDFLLTIPPTSISDAIFWKQEKDAVLAVTAVYALNAAIDMTVLMESTSDNAFAQKSFHAWYPIGRGAHNSTTGSISGVWNNAYDAIGRANQIIANIDNIQDINPTLKSRLTAEAQFHRAYHYNNLVNLFGDVPLILEPITLADSRELTRTPRDQVVQQILSDLEAAAAALPTSYTGSDRGRATRGAALALKARAALYAASWKHFHENNKSAADVLYTQAAAAAKAVMDLGVYDLHPTFGELTRYAGNNSAEIIFADQRLQNQRGQNLFNLVGPASLQGGNDVVPLRGLVDSFRMAGDGLPIDQSPLYDPANPYSGRDPRMYATILYPGAQFHDITYNSLPGSGTGDEVAKDFNTTATGYNFIKYVNWEDRNDRGNSGVHIILLRYADVLLMYAEARIELGQIDQSVFDAINAVRTRAGMPTVDPGASAAELRDIVRYERRAEFAME
ncbi:MAG TPA: RagB/SusD family nutrient uptake outer membrane protein, partial [Thermomicrobiales bacterium]|nr:RagB/SusD family nutrient uptake outer membrane protein [Thermomicrobiales bacterium]